MDDMGLFVAVAVVAYLGITMIFFKPRKTKEAPLKKSLEQEKKNKGKPSPDEVIDVLQFMLQNNIIDEKQYNQLIVKASPYL